MSSESPLPAPEADRILDGVLRLARRRLRRHYAAEIACGAAAIALGLLAPALAVAAAVPFSPAAQLATALAAAVAIGAFAVRRGILPWIRVGDVDRLALHLERSFPVMRSRLISAVQLRREIPQLARAPRFSEALARAVVADAARVASGVDLAASVPRGTWRRSSAIALLVATGLVVAAAVSPAAVTAAFANLAGGRTASTAREAREDSPPLVGDLTLRYHYPEYTRLPPRVVETSSGEISAVRGTVVQISARAVIPVRGAELRVNGETLPLHVEGNSLQGVITVVEPGSYRFVLTGEDGTVRAGSPHLKIYVERDRHPRVRILAPGPDVTVGERGRIEVRYSADDDFGLRDLWLVWRVEGATGKEKTRRLKSFEKDPRTAEGAVSLAVFDLGLRRGDKVAYRLRVHDGDLVSGPKAGDSAVQRLKVYSPRERHLDLLEQQRRAWESMVHLLGEEIVLGEEAKGADAAALGRAEAAARRTASRFAEVFARLDPLLAQIREDELFGERARAALEGVRRRLRERAGRESRWLQASVGGAAGRLARLRSFMSTHVEGMERDVLMLEKLLKQQKLEALKALAQELVDAQKRLQEMLDEYHRTRDPELKAEIEREIARLQEKIRELRAQLAGLFDADDEFVNLDGIRAGRLQRTLSQVQEALRKGDLDRAVSELEKMARELQNTLERVDLSAKAFYESAFYKTQKRMERLLDEVHELETAERQVASETRAIEKQARSRAARRLDVAKNPRTARLLRKLEQARRQAAEAGESLDSRWNRELASKARARAEDASRALRQGDAAESLEMAKRGLSHLQQLEENLSRARPWRLEPAGEKYERARQKAARGARAMSEAVRDLDRLVPKATGRLDETERQRLSVLRKRQGRLKQRAAILKRKLEEAGEETPFVGDEARKSLEEAHRQMGGAEEELRRGRPSEAVSREERAAQELGKLKDKLQQAMQPQPRPSGQKGEGEGADERRMSREKVQIPGAEEHRPPKEFREDLLEAMKQAAPAPYRDLVRRYYEELVR